jgi:hypothetical protein
VELSKTLCIFGINMSHDIINQEMKNKERFMQGDNTIFNRERIKYPMYLF